MTAPPIFTTFRYFRGTTFSSEPIVVQNPDRTPVNLTGWYGDMVIWRESASDAAPLFELSNRPGKQGLEIDGPNGAVIASIQASETDVDVFDDGELWPFKLTLTNPDAVPEAYVERLVQGYVVAQP